MQNYDKVLMDLDQIKSYLPHRSPLLLIDCVYEIVLGQKLVASKILTPAEPVFSGHFPGNPIYPGVYYIEAMAQASALLAFLERESKGITDEKFGVLVSVDETRFRQQGVPGDKVIYQVYLEKMRGNFVWFKGSAFIKDKLAVECKLSIAIGAPKGKK